MGGATVSEVASNQGGGGWRWTLRSQGCWGGAAPWPPDLEEGSVAAAALVVMAVRPAEGEAARERHWPVGVGPPVGVAAGGGEVKTAVVARRDDGEAWLAQAVAEALEPETAVEGGHASLQLDEER